MEGAASGEGRAGPTSVTPRGLLRALARVLAVGGLLMALGFPALVGVVAVHRNVWRPKRPPGRPLDLMAERTRAVEFPTGDGLHLRGSLALPRGHAPMLLGLHGVGANRDDVTPYLRPFAEAGYGVLTFDWRGHGESEGEGVRFGAVEGPDLVAALGLLESLPEARGRPVGVVAFSMGAAITAQSAASLPSRVRCLVLDSPYGHLGEMLDGRMAILGPLAGIASTSARVYARSFLGFDPDAVTPASRLVAFAPRPVFVLHGTLDSTTPVAQGRSVLEAYPGTKQGWFPVLEHVQARSVRMPEWMERVAGFLGEHLPGAPSSEVVLQHVPETVEGLTRGRGETAPGAAGTRSS